MLTPCTISDCFALLSSSMANVLMVLGRRQRSPGSGHYAVVVVDCNRLALPGLQALQKSPALLPYAPLLHLLPDIKDGDSVLKDVRAACMASGAASVARIMRDAASAIEKLMQSGPDSEGTPPAPQIFSLAPPPRAVVVLTQQ